MFKHCWCLFFFEDFDEIPSSYFKKLKGTDEIWECRIQFGSNFYRILCFFVNGPLAARSRRFNPSGDHGPNCAEAD